MEMEEKGRRAARGQEMELGEALYEVLSQHSGGVMNYIRNSPQSPLKTIILEIVDIYSQKKEIDTKYLFAVVV